MTKLQDFLNSPITNVAKMGRVAKVGDLFGLELECEGRNVDFDGDDKILLDWAPHQDGSLRMNHGSACEWVFNGPVKYKPAVERVNKLFDYFEKRKAKLVCSNRTSLHVHFNMGDKNAYQLVNMFILFTILEDILDRYCGEDRRGNLFCLSSRHAEEQVQSMSDSCFKYHYFQINANHRYASLNLASITKFGTVEFRGMRGLDNKEDVLSWLSILNEFCDYACYKMRNPVTLIESISAKTPYEFLREIFSRENFVKLTSGIPEGEINHSMYEGLRLVQMLCYRIGTEFDQVRLRGKDFWASFKDDAEPQRDIDPAAAPRNGDAELFRQLARGARAPRANPFLGRQEGLEGGLRPPREHDPFVRRQMPPVDPELQAARDENRRINDAAFEQALDALRRPVAGARPMGWQQQINAQRQAAAEMLGAADAMWNPERRAWVAVAPPVGREGEEVRVVEPQPDEVNERNGDIDNDF